MSESNFPQKRFDGSFIVASLFSVDDLEMVKRVEDYVAGWTKGLQATKQVDLLNDLSRAPHVVSIDEGQVQIVFEGRPGSRRWKDWMVYLTRDFEQSIPGATFRGFYDVIAGAVHPASV